MQNFNNDIKGVSGGVMGKAKNLVAGGLKTLKEIHATPKITLRLQKTLRGNIS